MNVSVAGAFLVVFDCRFRLAMVLRIHNNVFWDVLPAAPEAKPEDGDCLVGGSLEAPSSKPSIPCLLFRVQHLDVVTLAWAELDERTRRHIYLKRVPSGPGNLISLIGAFFIAIRSWTFWARASVLYLAEILRRLPRVNVQWVALLSEICNPAGRPAPADGLDNLFSSAVTR